MVKKTPKYSDHLTFNEIYESEPSPTLTGTTRTAYRVMTLLMDRKGFDWFWDTVDEETQDDIFECIKQTIQEGQE